MIVLKSVQNFNFKGNIVRTIQRDSLIWFAANDITQSLGLSNTTVAVRSLDSDEVTKFNLGSQSGETNFISEPGLYKLIGASRKPEAKKFNRWVTHEVLPSIRKHGAYLTNDAIKQAIQSPDFLIQLATELKNERDGRLIAEQRVAEYEPRITYLDSILATKSAVTTTQIAADYDMTAIKLNKILHNLHIQRKVGYQWILYANLMDMGYTKSDTVHFKHKDGRDDVSITTKWTQKGRMFIYQQLLDAGYVPTADMEMEV